MPTSDYHSISTVLDLIEQIHPSSVLDIGVGFGRWGVLCREILEVHYARILPERWETKIDGVEIHESYRNPFWGIAYNNVYVGNALDVIDQLGHYDLIICGDVIEHFDKEIGKSFLKKALDHADYVIITSPDGFLPQEAVYGNDHERHRSGWTEKDFRSMPYKFKRITSTFVAIVSSDQKKIDAINFYNELEASGLKKSFFMLLKLSLIHAKRRLKRTLFNTTKRGHDANGRR